MLSKTTKSPGFAELVAGLAAERVLSKERAKELLEREGAQTAQVRRSKIEQSRLAGSPTSDTTIVVSPLELFLSFGDPLREDTVTEAWAQLLGAPYVKLDPLKLDPAFTVRVVSKPFARKHGFLALDEKNGVLRIATSGPLDEPARESVERVTGKRVELVIASKSDVDRLITEFYGFRQSVQRAEKQIAVGIDLGNLEQFVRMKSESEIEASDEHVVHAVDYMLRYAFGQRASDIHIEPKRDDSAVRFRIDGSLHAVSRLPRAVHKAVVNRVKMLSRLDIAEKRKPQDGRIRTEFDGKSIDIRVSTLPVAYGEKLVLRIFDPAVVSDDLGTLGFFDRDKTLLDELIRQPHGIVLVTGPTGSGKTTTLYTALRKIATEDVNITTIEDPIENMMEEINQTAIHPLIGLGFAEILRTILRQDPDVVMVGEIRDLETARHAIQAALTGHLVFSTLHTNDAASAITRLVDLGVQRFLLASTLSGVMAQRLVKKNCLDCATERALSEDEVRALGLDEGSGSILVRQGTGCATCRRTGYQGRSAIVELFKVTGTIRSMIHDGADERAIKEQARKDGMLSLREAAVMKLLLGETSYDQVIEVTSEDAS